MISTFSQILAKLINRINEAVHVQYYKNYLWELEQTLMYVLTVSLTDGLRFSYDRHNVYAVLTR